MFYPLVVFENKEMVYLVFRQRQEAFENAFESSERQNHAKNNVRIVGCFLLL